MPILAHISFSRVWPRPSAAPRFRRGPPWRRPPGRPPELGSLRPLLFARGCQPGGGTRVDAKAGRKTQSAWTARAGSAPTALLPGEQLWLTSARAAFFTGRPPGKGCSHRGGGVHPGQAELVWRGVGGSWRSSILSAWLILRLLKPAITSFPSFQILPHPPPPPSGKTAAAAAAANLATDSCSC